MILNNCKLILAEPRGFCAGVDRAIEIVNQAIKTFNEANVGFGTSYPSSETDSSI